jgi:hypothetical protein
MYSRQRSNDTVAMLVVELVPSRASTSPTESPLVRMAIMKGPASVTCGSAAAGADCDSKDRMVSETCRGTLPSCKSAARIERR